MENFRCYPGLPGISNDANPTIEARIEFSVGTALILEVLRELYRNVSANVMLEIIHEQEEH